MQKKQNHLCMDLKLAEAQIESLLVNKVKPKQSANSAAIESYMAGIISLSKIPQFNKTKDL